MNVVRVMLLNEKAVFPTYADEGAAGFDFYSTSNLVIPVGGSGIIETGLAVEIPKGYEIQARGRSGLAFKGDIVAHFGTIDESYRGEVKIKLWNLGKKPFKIVQGMRIAQGVLAPVERALFMEAYDLSKTSRGVGGIGSTGE
jgi:dUTP pyrophosphatase